MFADSLLEGDGFEPSVPRDRTALSNTSKPYECMYFRDRHSGVRTWPIATGNRWFESISLQRRVRRTPTRTGEVPSDLEVVRYWDLAATERPKLNPSSRQANTRGAETKVRA